MSCRAPEEAGGRFGRCRAAGSWGSRHLAATGPDHTLDHACEKDRIIAMVRDSYWLHAYWELSRSTLSRAQAALGKSGTRPGRSCG